VSSCQAHRNFEMDKRVSGNYNITYGNEIKMISSLLSREGRINSHGCRFAIGELAFLIKEVG